MIMTLFKLAASDVLDYSNLLLLLFLLPVLCFVENYSSIFLHVLGYICTPKVELKRRGAVVHVYARGPGAQAPFASV